MMTNVKLALAETSDVVSQDFEGGDKVVLRYWKLCCFRLVATLLL